MRSACDSYLELLGVDPEAQVQQEFVGSKVDFSSLIVTPKARITSTAVDWPYHFHGSDPHKLATAVIIKEPIVNSQ